MNTIGRIYVSIKGTNKHALLINESREVQCVHPIVVDASS
jgi:hypothetical protein